MFSSVTSRKSSIDWSHITRWMVFIGMATLAILLLFDRSLRAETSGDSYLQRQHRENLYTRQDPSTEIAVVHQQVDQNTAAIQNLWKTYADFQKSSDDRDREMERSLDRIEGGGGMFLVVITVLQLLGLIRRPPAVLEQEG